MQAHRAAIARWTATVLAFPLAAVPFVVVDVPFDHPGGVHAPRVARLAFTDDRDDLVVKTVRQEADVRSHPEKTYTVLDGQSAPPDVGPSVTSATHTGEASANHGSYAFVSTIDDPNGEVYVVLDDSGGARRVTCNDSVETHPVLDSRATAVAYASDQAGTFDIWVTTLNPDPVDVDSCAASRTTSQLTSGPAADLWPEWVFNGTGLVFSSDRANPLGDIFAMSYPRPGSTASPLPDDPIPLTDDTYADTQPSVGFVGGVHWVAFTTTRYRQDGSLALLRLSNKPDQPVFPFWRDPDYPYVPATGTMQSSEAAWSPSRNEILFTTTRDDPYGDVHFVPVDQPELGEPPVPLLAPSDSVPLAATPGVAETHGTWITGFASEGTSDAVVGFTTRSIDADLSDVLASDGSGRRVLVAQTVPAGSDPAAAPYDEAGPTYSPDGGQVAYSRAPDAAGGRRLMTAQSDGQGITELMYDRNDGDIDVDPAWSPDGTRIAFVRHAWNGEGYDAPAVWVTTLATGDTYRVSQAGEAGELRYDDNPTWSPDSSRLAIARASVRTSDASAAIEAPELLIAGTPGKVDVLVGNAGPSPAIDAVVEIAVPAALTDDPATPEGCTKESLGEDTLFRCGVTGLESEPQVFTIELYGAGIGDHTVEASVSTDLYDPDPCNDSASAVVTVPDYDINIGRGPAAQSESAQCPPVEPDPVRAAPGSPPIPATPQIWTIDATDGSGETALTTRPVDCSAPPCDPVPLYGRSPAWSHDGSRIAYESNGELRAAVLAVESSAPVVPEEVTTIEHLTGFDASGLPTASRGAISVAEDPAWAPDDSAVGFAGQPAGQPDQRGIYEIEADGTGLREVAQLRQPETEPAYQPFPVFPPISYSPTTSVSVSTTTATVTTTAPEEEAELSVTVGLAQAEAWVGGEPVVATYTVRNDGAGAAEDVRLSTAYPAFVAPVARTGTPACATGASECLLGTIAPGAVRTVRATISLQAEVVVPSAPGVPPSTAPAVTAGVGEVTGRITSADEDSDPTDDSAAVTFTVHQPTIRLLPPIGRPGEVVLAYGEEFPPDAAIELRWSRGITADSRSFPVEPDGTFRRPLLVIRRDVLGERLVAAAAPATARRLFGGVSADMLVVPRSVSPPSFVGRG